MVQQWFSTMKNSIFSVSKNENEHLFLSDMSLNQSITALELFHCLYLVDARRSLLTLSKMILLILPMSLFVGFNKWYFGLVLKSSLWSLIVYVFIYFYADFYIFLIFINIFCFICFFVNVSIGCYFIVFYICIFL